MTSMSPKTSPYQEVIETLPPGSFLVLHDVPWRDYEQLLEDIGSLRPGLRMTYDQGRLEVMSPLLKHEKSKDFVAQLVRVFADELGIPLESAGSTTWKNKKKRTGFEPDTCFHIAHAKDVIGKDELQFGIDPPPDLAVEVEVTSRSDSKFPLYAAFGVPEIWRYTSRKRSCIFYELQEGAYVEIGASRSFPMLTPDVLAQFIEESFTAGQSATLAKFRRWVRRHNK